MFETIIKMGTARVSATNETRGIAEDTRPEFPSILAAGQEALDLLNVGVAVTDSSGRVLFANQTTEQILLARDGLVLTDDRVIASVSRWSNSVIARAVQQAALAFRSGEPECKDAILAVRRPRNKRPLTLLVRPLKSKKEPADPAEPAVLIFIWDPELPVHDTEEGLRELFGFTICEARLAKLLMEGKNVDDCCHQLDIRASTVRMHLANLFAKTGVQRQGQLVSLLWKSVGMVRTRCNTSSLADAQPRISSREYVREVRNVVVKKQRAVASDAVTQDCRF
jgi:DNA-binding CsgD family transcriptional regulator